MIKNKDGVLIGLRGLKNADKTAAAYLGKDGVLRDKLPHHWSIGVHIYLLTQDKPKLGEWVFDDEYFLNSKMEEDWDAVIFYKTDEKYYRIGKDARKIIATTDPKILYEIGSSEPLDFFIPDKLSNNQLKEIIEIFNK